MGEARYKGTKVVSIFPDYAEGAKFGDLWLHPKQGTDAALALAMGHVILKEFHLTNKNDYFLDYCRRYSDMPFLVRMVNQGDRYVPERMLDRTRGEKGQWVSVGVGIGGRPSLKTKS